ncbi:hypothetical protein NX059_003423 [Plenodomus lindquistii]|nr:hypothetical protein NX059_003423 [Plenodomus lindquistii]
MAIYDEASGQVFTETVSDEVRSMIPAWSRYTSGRRVDPSTYKERWNGTASLKDTAMRSCLWRINDIEPSALQWLGWHYASQIYNELKKADTLSYNAWNIFQRAFPDHIDRHHAFRYHDADTTTFWSKPNPSTPIQLPSIVDRFSKLDSSTLSFLCIQNLHFNVDHLFSLLKISNLAVLILDPELRGNSLNLTSKNISDWGRAARETDAFQKLKVLVLLGMASNMTLTLDQTMKFPSLVLFGTQRPSPGGSHSQRPDCGWLKTDEIWWKDKLSSATEKTPRQIWIDPKITKVTQMQMLYDLATKLAQGSTATADPKSRVSLSYGWPQRNAQAKEVSWFFRNRKQDAGLASKRSSDALSLQQKTAEPDKKRKMRGSKKADIGSLLDLFM